MGRTKRSWEKDLTRLPSKQELRWLRTRRPLAYRESTCTNLSVSCPYEIIVYSVLKHINTARMHTISQQFIPLTYRPLGKRILSNIQPILPFHQREIVLSSYFICLNFEKYIRVYIFMTIQYLKNVYLIPSRSNFASPVLLDHIPSTFLRSQDL